jgi:hypothetical protein
VIATVPATTVVTKTPAPKRAPKTSSGREAVTPANDEKMSTNIKEKTTFGRCVEKIQRQTRRKQFLEEENIEYC